LSRIGGFLLKSLFGVIILILFIVTGCDLETKTLTEFYSTDLNDVTKITVIDGSTGNKKVMTDQGVVEEFLAEIKDIEFIPDKNQEKRTGWRYSITLYQQDEQRTFQFTLNEVDGHYYHTKPDIYPVVNGFYEKLDSLEEE
jgi:hypothetical protein